MTQKRTFNVIQPLSMRLLVIVSILAQLVLTGVLLHVTMREQKTVNITIMNGEKP